MNEKTWPRARPIFHKTTLALRRWLDKSTAMGLDGVEIVMKVEDAFGITIDDGEAGKIATPGQLIDLVLSKVGRTVDEACLTQRAFHRVRAALMRRMGVSRNQIRPDILGGKLVSAINETRRCQANLGRDRFEERDRIR